MPYYVADGSERTVDLIILPIKDESGNVLFLAPTGTDITDRKRAETERERFFAVGADLLVVVGFDGYFKKASPTCESTLGWTPEELTSRPWLNFLHPDDREATLRLDREVMQGREVLSFVNRYRHRDGSYRWLSWKARPYPAEGLIYAGATDVTDRKQAVEALAQSEQRWRTMAEALPNLLWTDLPDGQCDWLSTQWGRYTGIPEHELLGLRWLETVLHPDDRERTLACWKAACEDRADYDLEYRIRRHDGEYHWFKTRGVPMRDEHGRIIYWFGTCTDIEDVKRLEAALRDADRRKDEFLATLAHELRNPLAPLRNGLQIMRLAAGEPQAIDDARKLMERQVAHMVRLIDDLMDVSRITRGKLELRREKVKIASVIHAAVETSRPLVESLGHRLTVTLPEAPVVVDADPTRLAQVLSNLLNNAAKYTEPGGVIALTVECQATAVAVSVRDNGIGIPPEMLPQIFDMFTQVDGSLGKSQGGLGIGLTLVRKLVEMHGGSVEARSAGHGSGSEFLIRLPVVEALDPLTLSPEPEPVASIPTASRRVLVVDDNRDSAETLAQLLDLLGHETRTAFDGAEAVACADAFRPDVILLDIGLPVMSGYEVAALIRQRDWSEPVLIVALTGWGQDADRLRSKEAGIDRHLVKPVDPAALQAMLAEERPGSASITALDGDAAPARRTERLEATGSA